MNILVCLAKIFWEWIGSLTTGTDVMRVNLLIEWFLMKIYFTYFQMNLYTCTFLFIDYQWISIHVLFYLSIIIPESYLKTHSFTNIAGWPYNSCLMIIVNKISTILAIEIRGIFMECWEHDSASISNSSWRLKLSARAHWPRAEHVKISMF